jgi:hypothetical protein
MSEMNEARRYLKEALERGRHYMKHVSRVLGRNDAYIQQYIKNGVPEWLDERDRELLKERYGIDPAPLKPPAKQPKPLLVAVRGASDVDPQLGAEIKDELLEQQFLDLWSGLRIDAKIATVNIMREVAKISGRKVS